jgi:beta-lactamase regulating signal transducer with metallopeptidase domain
LHARSDHRIVLGLEAALGALGFAAAGVALTAAAHSVHRDPRAAHVVDVLGARLTYPAVNAAALLLLLLAVLGAAVVLSTLASAYRQGHATRRFMRSLPVVGSLPGHHGVTVLDDQVPQAFCAGLLRPHVFISSGAVNLLGADELAAVIQHEQQHQRARDPLRLAATRVLRQALFFVPALRPLGERYDELAEQRADAAAVTASAGDRAPLASALLAFDSIAPSGAAGISPERIDSLLGVLAPRRLPLTLTAVSAAVLSLLIVVAWRASAAASAGATFNLPVVSAQPCVLVLAFIPLVLGVTALTLRR